MQPTNTQPAGVGDWIVDTNWSVYGADLRKVGTVDDVQPDYLVVRKGVFFRRPRYIPVSTIFNIDRQCVYINVSLKDIEDRGWDRLPDRPPSNGESAEPSGQQAGSTTASSARAA
jgi:hypothetical protein